MRAFGLRPSELKKIHDLLQAFFGNLSDAKIYLFGSRATGKQKDYSDIDLAINSKAKNLHQSISLLKEEWEKSSIPYNVDIVLWSDISKAYLPRIRKEKFLFWRPESKDLHPWRVCPYGEHWVVRHDRRSTKKIQDVDGHCRRNSSGKDVFYGDEITHISQSESFLEASPSPCLYAGDEKIINPNQYDALIAGWSKYWNDIFKPDIPIHPNFVKTLIETESRFKSETNTPNRLKKVGNARGLIQITEQTWKILKDKKGEIKDHYVDLKKEELLDPSKNICAGIRWLFHKREMLKKRIGRAPKWSEVVVEYKGLGRQLKNNSPKAVEIMKEFDFFLERYKC